MPDLRSLGEFGLIERLTGLLSCPPPGVLGIGDDTAVLPPSRGPLLATTDSMVENVHFRLDWTSPEDLGWKLLAQNVSDIASMGGRPTWALVSVAAPPTTEVAWLEALYRGLREMAEASQVSLVGGDTVSAGCLTLTVALLGEAPTGRPVLRSGARSGDTLLVTGTLGDSRAGLELLRRGIRDPGLEGCLRAHHRPQPRLAEGLAAAEVPGVHAMIDLSDGLSGDLRHLGAASGLGAVVEAEALPISPVCRAACERLGLDALEVALAGGEDYELLIAADPAAAGAVAERVAAAGGSLTPIGRMAAEAAFLCRRGGVEEPLESVSWDHFASRP